MGKKCMDNIYMNEFFISKLWIRYKIQLTKKLFLSALNLIL